MILSNVKTVTDIFDMSANFEFYISVNLQQSMKMLFNSKRKKSV